MNNYTTFVDYLKFLKEPTKDNTRLDALISLVETPSIVELLTIAPASTSFSFHHSVVGGLCLHITEMLKGIHSSVSWLYTQRSIYPSLELPEDPYDLIVSLAIVIVLHDINKLGDPEGNFYYIPNILKSGKVSDAKPFSHNKECGSYFTEHSSYDSLTPNGKYCINIYNMLDHYKVPCGIRSISYIKTVASAFYNMLTPDELHAIRYHDGAYGPSGMSVSGTETPLMLILHLLDMFSSRFTSHRKSSKE